MDAEADRKIPEIKIEIKTLVNDQKTCYYNIVCVDDETIINYNDNGPIDIKNLPGSFFIENIVELKNPW